MLRTILFSFIITLNYTWAQITTPYSEGFETGLNGWTVNSGWEVGVPTTSSNTPVEGDSLIGTILDGNYSNSATYQLTSPLIIIDSNDILSWHHFYTIESGWDDLRVRVIDDSLGTVSTIWTDYSTNNNGQWHQTSLSLNNFAGKKVQIRFELSSDGSNTYQGWYLDNIQISPPTAPVVTSHPSDTSVIEGSTFTFSVTVDGADLSYQWRLNGVDIIGATTSSYTANAELVNDGANYDVIVSNVTGADTSDAATLSVTPVPVSTGYFTQGFENGLGDWTVTNGGWEVGTPSDSVYAPYTGDSLVATLLNSNYGNSSLYQLTSPYIEISSGSQLSWMQNWSIESCCDGLFVSAKSKSSATWQVIYTSNDESSSYGAWEQRILDLSSMYNDTVQFRFTFDSDGSVSDDGYYIDEIKFEALSAPVILDTLPEIITYDNSYYYLNVNATGSDLSYTWYKDGVEIVGATSNFEPVTFYEADDGKTVSVIVSNSAGSDTVSTTVKIVQNPADHPDITLDRSFNNDSLFSVDTTFTFSAEATDPNGSITHVEFYMNGFLIGVDSTAGNDIYTFTFDEFRPGEHYFYAVAYDDEGASTTSYSMTLYVRGTPQYSIFASAVGDGSINSAGTRYFIEGDNKGYYFTPAAGSQLDSVVINGSNIGTPDTYEFSNIRSHHIITAYFAELPSSLVHTQQIQGLKVSQEGSFLRINSESRQFISVQVVNSLGQSISLFKGELGQEDRLLDMTHIINSGQAQFIQVQSNSQVQVIPVNRF